jgi:hypothetical protein
LSLKLFLLLFLKILPYWDDAPREEEFKKNNFKDEILKTKHFKRTILASVNKVPLLNTLMNLWVP